MSGWRLLALERGLGAHAAAWDGLQRELAAHPLLASSTLAAALAGGDGAAARRYLAVLEEGGHVAGMCLLVPRTHRVWTCVQSPLSGAGALLLADAGQLAGIWACLPPQVWRLELQDVEPEAVNLPQAAWRMDRTPVCRIALEGSFADYLAARPRGLQASLRRQLAHTAHAALRLVQRPEVDAALPGVSAVELWQGERLLASRRVAQAGAVLALLPQDGNARQARAAGGPHALSHRSAGRLLVYLLLQQLFSEGLVRRVELPADRRHAGWASGHYWRRQLLLPRHGLAAAMLAAKPALVAQRSAGAATGDAGWSASLAGLPADALSFLAQAERSNLEFGAVWYANLQATVFASDSGVRFYFLRRKGRVMAVLPLLAQRGGGGVQLRALSNFYTTLYQPALAPDVRAQDLLPLLTALRRDWPGLASFTLSPMDPQSHAYLVLLEALRLQGWLGFEYFSFGNWYQTVREDYEQYFATRKARLRNTIKRMGKKFDAEGGRLEILTAPDAVRAHVASYESVYAASWKKAEPFQHFMPGLLNSFAQRGAIRLGLAWLNGQPVAAQVWMVGHGRAAIYKVAYREDSAKWAPGTLLTDCMMKHVLMQDRVKEIDYLIGDDAYKQEWMNARRERWGMVAYQPRAVAAWLPLVREIGGRLSARWRRKPAPGKVKAGGSAVPANGTGEPAEAPADKSTADAA